NGFSSPSFVRTEKIPVFLPSDRVSTATVSVSVSPGASVFTGPSKITKPADTDAFVSVSGAAPSFAIRKVRPLPAGSEFTTGDPRSNVDDPSDTPRNCPRRIMLNVTSGIGPVPADTMFPVIRNVNGDSFGSLFAIETNPSSRRAVPVVIWIVNDVPSPGVSVVLLGCAANAKPVGS